MKGRDPILYGLTVAFILAVVGSVIYLHLTIGLSAVVVDGRSMLPTLQTGDVVLIVSPRSTNITVGDVVVYRYTGPFYGYYLNNALIIHRVVGVYYYNDTLCVVTKGDNNPVPDPGYPQVCGYTYVNGTQVSGVPYHDIIGVAVGGGRPLVIPYIGSLSLLLRPVQGPT